TVFESATTQLRGRRRRINKPRAARPGRTAAPSSQDVRWDATRQPQPESPVGFGPPVKAPPAPLFEVLPAAAPLPPLAEVEPPVCGAAPPVVEGLPPVSVPGAPPLGAPPLTVPLPAVPDAMPPLPTAPPAPPIPPVLPSAGWNFSEFKRTAPPKTAYTACTPVVLVSVQDCVAQLPAVAVTSHLPISVPVCVSACSSMVVAACALTRKSTLFTPPSLKSTLS